MRTRPSRSSRILRTLRIGLLAMIPVTLTSAGCASDAPPPALRTAADSQAAHVADVVAAGGVVDSILPIAEHLHRFRASIPAPDTLRHASASVDALVARWAEAISTRDTAALNRMILDRAEFAWLYYPDSRMSKPPYEAPPELLWGQILASSDQGARRLLERHAGRPLVVHSVRCPAGAEEGANRIREGCTVRLRAGDTLLPEAAYFGSIIERDGRFKFIGLANRL